MLPPVVRNPSPGSSVSAPVLKEETKAKVAKAKNMVEAGEFLEEEV
jgi:hypothetical protein